MQTPSLPVACAYPVAAWPAPCSCRTRTWRTRVESISGSMAGRIVPPGIPNTVSAPTSSRERMRDCAPVTCSTGADCSPERGPVQTGSPSWTGSSSWTPSTPSRRRTTPSSRWRESTVEESRADESKAEDVEIEDVEDEDVEDDEEPEAVESEIEPEDAEAVEPEADLVEDEVQDDDAEDLAEDAESAAEARSEDRAGLPEKDGDDS
ncbi:hypothetical protein SANTM175S_00989 [Streptomyces antimycoticus]